MTNPVVEFLLQRFSCTPYNLILLAQRFHETAKKERMAFIRREAKLIPGSRESLPLVMSVVRSRINLQREEHGLGPLRHDDQVFLAGDPTDPYMCLPLELMVAYVCNTGNPFECMLMLIACMEAGCCGGGS